MRKKPHSFSTSTLFIIMNNFFMNKQIIFFPPSTLVVVIFLFLFSINEVCYIFAVQFLLQLTESFCFDGISISNYSGYEQWCFPKLFAPGSRNSTLKATGSPNFQNVSYRFARTGYKASLVMNVFCGESLQFAVLICQM